MEKLFVLSSTSWAGTVLHVRCNEKTHEALELTTHRVDNYIHWLDFKLLPEVRLAVIDAFTGSKLLQQGTT